MSKGRSANATVLSAVERDRAKSIGAYIYLKSLRYRTFREPHFFSSLDAAVQSMERLKFPNPYDGQIIGALVKVMLHHDPKAIGVLRRRKVAALDEPAALDDLLTLTGLLIAEEYLHARREKIPTQSYFSAPAGVLDALGDLIDQMRDHGQQMASQDVLKNELAVTIEGLNDPTEIVRTLIAEALGTYESLIPESDDGGIPDPVQRRSISKAAFLRLGLKELEELALAEGVSGLPNKKAMADALAERHGQDLDQVARMVIRQAEGDPGFGLVTRLLPLREAPNLDAAVSAFTALRGRYFEPRIAVFFLFGDVQLATTVLRITGRILSFTVNPVEAAGQAQIYAKPISQDVMIILRAGKPWAEIDTRRSSDLHVIKTTLLRSGEVRPSAAVDRPATIEREPYSAWDSRTLWVLDFLRRDLQAPELKLDDTLMANFVSSDGDALEPDDQSTPNLQAVRLLGRQLHEHPEACARIASGAHLRDVELRIKKVTDRRRNLSRLVRVRLSWENDHLAVLSGATTDETFDRDLHNEMVRLVRNAASRQLGEDSLLFMLRQIERRASDGLIPADGGSVLEEPQQLSRTEDS